MEVVRVDIGLQWVRSGNIDFYILSADSLDLRMVTGGDAEFGESPLTNT